MGSEPSDRRHPVNDFAGLGCGKLSELAARPVWSMGSDDLRRALLDLARAVAQLTALRLRVLAEAERTSATDSQAVTTADWFAVEARQVRARLCAPTFAWPSHWRSTRSSPRLWRARTPTPHRHG